MNYDISDNRELTEYTIKGEQWRFIPNFDKYLVSNYGRLWNLKRQKPIPMQLSQWRTVEAKPRRTKRTYLRVQLYGRDSEGKAYTKAAVVHRLVASAWIENDDPEHKNIVDHIDNDPFNNMACNLRWVSNSQNLKYAQTNEQAYTRWLIEKTQGGSVLNNVKVKDVDEVIQ